MDESLATRHRFSKSVSLSAAEISAFADAAGDPNPIHHDPEWAKQSRYGGIVASGPQTSAMLMGLNVSQSNRGAM